MVKSLMKTLTLFLFLSLSSFAAYLYYSNTRLESELSEKDVQIQKLLGERHADQKAQSQTLLSIQGRLANLHNRKSDLESRISVLQSREKEEKAILLNADSAKNLKELIAKKREELSALNAEKKALQGGTQESRQNYKALVLETKATESEFRKNIRELEAQIKEMRAELQGLKAQRPKSVQMRDRIATLQGQIQEKTDAAHEVQAQLANQREKDRQILGGAGVDAKLSNSQLEEAILEEQKTIQKLEKELQLLEQSNLTSKDRISKYVVETDRLKHELKDIDDQIAREKELRANQR